MKRSQETEKRIIEAALALFVRKGYHGTSINEITQKINLTKGALYSHFDSKGALLLRIIDEFKVKYVDELTKAGKNCRGNALDKFHCMISFGARFALNNVDLSVFLTFLSTELKADVDFEPALKGVYSEFHKYVADLIRHGIRQGLFREDLSPDLQGTVYLALHDGILHQWTINRDHLDGVQYMRAFRRMFFYGVVKRQADAPSG